MSEEKEKELLKLKRKYSLKYILIAKMLEVYLFFILFTLLCFSLKRIGYGIIAIILFAFHLLKYFPFLGKHIYFHIQKAFGISFQKKKHLVSS